MLIVCNPGFECAPLKVLSTENKEGSKIAPIIRYWSLTMTLDVMLSFKWPISYISIFLCLVSTAYSNL
jgi:hypothetical protein